MGVSCCCTACHASALAMLLALPLATKPACTLPLHGHMLNYTKPWGCMHNTMSLLFPASHAYGAPETRSFLSIKLTELPADMCLLTGGSKRPKFS